VKFAVPALALAVATLLVAACGATPVPPTAVPTLRAQAAAATPSAAATSGVAMPTPSPAPTATPGPLAASFPLVANCAASAVPDAATVATPNTSKKAVTLRVPILMYHRIVPVTEAGDSLPGLVVTPQRFAAQMDGLAAAGWHTITMAALGADLQAGIRPAAKSFVITFDDGYDDGYTYALPILQAHGYVATFYVIPGRFDRAAFLTSDHVRALAAAGMDIGDHTLNHVALGTRTLPAVEYQVEAAAARIAQVTGRWPSSFAYPFGRMSNEARQGVAACGQLRTAVIEAPPKVIVPASPGASGAPAPSTDTSVDPSADPSASPGPTAAPKPVPSKVPAFPAVYETWANRFELPRLRITPSVSAAWIVAMLAPYA
jgi:peptidoglycan/xylan/chitin deacetylase (PgdA/CDA1 family)